MPLARRPLGGRLLAAALVLSVLAVIGTVSYAVLGEVVRRQAVTFRRRT